MRWLCCHSLEKGVAEHAIGCCRTIEIADPCIECRGIDDAGREPLLPYGCNHPRERLPREAVDQIRCCGVNVDDPRRYGRRVIAGLQDRKSTRLNSSHSQISYAVFCLKKKKNRKSIRTAGRMGLSQGRQPPFPRRFNLLTPRSPTPGL